MRIPRYLAALIKAIILIAIMEPGSVAAQSVREAEAWAAARFINTTAAYRWFLEMFPDGRYAGKAFDLVAKDIPPNATPTPASPAAPAAPAAPGGTEWDLDTGLETAEGLY